MLQFFVKAKILRNTYFLSYSSAIQRELPSWDIKIIPQKNLNNLNTHENLWKIQVNVQTCIQCFVKSKLLILAYKSHFPDLMSFQAPLPHLEEAATLSGPSP